MFVLPSYAPACQALAGRKASEDKPGPRQRSFDFTFFLLGLCFGALLGVVWANFARLLSCGHSRFLDSDSFLKNVSAFLARF